MIQGIFQETYNCQNLHTVCFSFVKTARHFHRDLPASTLKARIQKSNMIELLFSFSFGFSVSGPDLNLAIKIDT